jgi:7,8-dihydro-6-hydroxymethylpterin dimethyltransferase
MEIPPFDTESVCPDCLRKVPATIRLAGKVAFLKKRCPEHGTFQTPVWRGEPAYERWVRPKIPQPPPVPLTAVQKGCPLDCGLCPDHRQRSCTVLIEVTERCNLGCPVCYADAGSGSGSNSGRSSGPDPSLDTIAGWFRTARRAAPQANIQLSGGEPTVRDDLPSIVALGRGAGFGFIQLNTNGLRIATEPAYLAALKAAGLASVFLQFDGVDDAVYLKLRGRALLDVKLAAIQACAQHGIGVVLTPTLVPGVNTDAVGAILKKAVALSPTVRAVHFQPISYFGRFRHIGGDIPPGGPEARLTLPELMHLIEAQSEGVFAVDHFKPPGCENARCSFHGNFLVMPEGRVMPLQQNANQSCCGADGKGPAAIPAAIPAAEGAAKATAYVRRQWAAPNLQPMALHTDEKATAPPATDSERGCCGDLPSLEAFVSRARRHTLSVSAMAFQDAWNLDLSRVRDCCIHVMAPDHRLIPFCLYNLTGSNGQRLYRR